jgi:iron-sulfur cluster protein
MKGSRDIGSEIHAALASPTLRRALGNAMETLGLRRESAFDGIDFPEARRRVRGIKEYSLARNQELLARLISVVEQRGDHIFVAASAAEARDYVTDLAQARGVRLVVKSKSMVTEEIHLNPALEEAGVEVVETDLGERIIQLAGERPSHLIVPAVHKTKEEVISLFAHTMGISDPPTEAEGLTRLVRDDLRERFLRADMGITGANFVVADTGTLVVVENEGNVRLATQLPPIHVAVTGLEKLIARLDDVAPFLELLPRSATGQLLTSYISFITGRPSTQVTDFGRATGAAVTERESHLVIVDNGRSAAMADHELREALYCIRCGACLNACAPYTTVGGHVYGADPYPGGIGCIWTYITKGHDEARDINGLCTTCSRCTEVCPVMIDIPWLNTVVKQRNNREFGVGFRERVFARTDLLGDVLSPLGPSADALARTSVGRSVLTRLGVDEGIDLPHYERPTLERWFARRSHESVGASARRVVLFVDCFTNHNLPQVGMAAVRVLEAMGATVSLAHDPCCGRPAMSQGLLERPRAWAAENLVALGALIDAGCDVVCLEPSCLSTLREDYRRLLEATEWVDDRRVDLLEEHCFDVSEYVLMGARDGWSRLTLERRAGDFVVHGHCHQKSLGLGPAPAEALRLVPGVVVHEVDTLCCGMVGSFGYKREYAELSRAIGSKLYDLLAAHPGQIVTSGMSCRAQIEAGTGRKVVHPVEVLAEALPVETETGGIGRPDPSAPGGGVVRLVVYSAPDCHLCDIALDRLAPISTELDLEVVVIDISGDPELEERYRKRIPVGEIQDRVVFKFEIDEPRLRRAVEEARRAPVE